MFIYKFVKCSSRRQSRNVLRAFLVLSCASFVAIYTCWGQGEQVFKDCVENPVANRKCNLPANQVVQLTHPLEVRASGLTITCGSNSRIVKGANGTLLNISGKKVQIIGCGFDGVAHQFTGDVLNTSNTSDVTFSGITVTNAQRFGLYINNSSNVIVRESTFGGGLSDAIFIARRSSGIQIIHNTLDGSSGEKWHHVIGAHSAERGAFISDLLIQNNQIRNGSSFCVEVGAFRGDPPQNVIVSGNTCEQVAVTTSCGGYSFDTVHGAKIMENTYTNRNGRAGRLAGIELVSGRDAVASNNKLYDAGISIDKQSHTTVDHNKVTNAGIWIGASRPADISHNTIEYNDIQFVSGTNRALTFGIRVQNNAPGVDCSNLKIVENTLEGNGIRGGIAIKVENSHPGVGPDVSGEISGNKVTGWPSCYSSSRLGVSISAPACSK